jgi:hypothetical protein
MAAVGSIVQNVNALQEAPTVTATPPSALLEIVYVSGHISLMSIDGLLVALLETGYTFSSDVESMLRSLKRKEYLFANRHGKSAILLAYEAFCYKHGFAVTKGSYWLKTRFEMQEFVDFCGGPSNFSFSKHFDIHYKGGGIQRVKIDLKQIKPQWQEVFTEPKILQKREWLGSKKRKHSDI